ncbi:MAG: hypothetical protein ACOCXA_02530 [Planctomycetota bacterium]
MPEDIDTDKLARDLESLKADLRQLREDIAATGRDSWDTLGSSWREGVNKAQDTVRENPTTSLLTAAGIGFVIGLLFGSGKD